MFSTSMPLPVFLPFPRNVFIMIGLDQGCWTWPPREQKEGGCDSALFSSLVTAHCFEVVMMHECSSTHQSFMSLCILPGIREYINPVGMMHEVSTSKPTLQGCLRSS